jgi:hypothetical protein
LDTCPVRSLLYFAAAQWQRASSIRLAMDLATILTTIWVCPPKYAQVRNLYFKEIGRLKTSVDTLPMSGGQGVPWSIDFGSLKIVSDPRFRNGADSHEAAAKESTYA